MTENIQATQKNSKDLYPEFMHKPGATLLEVLGLKLNGYKKDISFNLRSGEIMGIAGLNNSGKTELLRALYGLNKCAAGIISINSKHGKAKKNSAKQSLKNGICYISSESSFFDHLTPAENAALPVLSKFTTLGFVRQNKLNTAFEKAILKLKELGFSSASSLIKFARVLLAESAVIICDNITANLDSQEITAFFKLLDELACEGKSIIISSDSTEELLNISDTIAVIHNGELCPPRPAQKWTFEEINLYENSGKLGAVSIL